MRLVFLISLIQIVGLQIHAQKPVSQNWWKGSEATSFASLNAGLNANSSDFSNRFLSELIFSDQLSQEVMNDQLKGLHQTENVMGMDYELALQGGWNIKSGAHTLLFKAADVGHVNTSVPKNAARLILAGNKSFAGDTLDFSGLNGLAMRYQQLAVGWQFQPTPSTAFFALIGFINGEQYADARVDRSWLYTSVLGDTLSTSLKGGLFISDTGNVGFATQNGAGASLDFGFHAEFQGEGSIWQFDFAVNNLGLVQWNKKTIGYNFDTNYTWTGIEIPDVTNINEQFANNLLTDSLSGGVNENIGKQTRNEWLPGYVAAELLQRRDAGFETGGGWVLRWNANYDPFVYLKNGYRFNEHIATHLSIGYGGYGTVQLGLSGVFEWSSFAARAEIRNIEALVLPKKFAGGSGLINLSYMF